MTTQPLQIEHEKFFARYTRDSDCVVSFGGKIGIDNAQKLLNPFLDAIHEKVVEKKDVRQVLVDLNSLEFMNSSAFKAFIHWVERIRSLEETSRYKLRFRLSQEVQWQRTCVYALSAFARDVIEVESH